MRTGLSAGHGLDGNAYAEDLRDEPGLSKEEAWLGEEAKSEYSEELDSIIRLGGLVLLGGVLEICSE